MDKGIIEILKKQGRLYMEQDYKDLFAELDVFYKQKYASKICSLDGVSFSLLAKVEREIETELKSNWKYLTEECEYGKIGGLTPFIKNIEMLNSRKRFIKILKERVANES